MAEVYKGAKMENATYSALYYPSIEFADPQWLWASSLIWDRIYRIVPKDYAPEDSENIRKLSETGEIGIPIHPDEYAKAVSAEFIEKLHSRHWDAAALSGSLESDYARLHHDKVDVQLRNLIVAKGRGASHGDWLYVPTDFEALYMTYLANYVSKKANLNLVTDASAAWTGSMYFSFDGRINDWPSEECPQVLAAMLIRDFVPVNIMNILPKELLSFRERRRDERHRFIGAVTNAAEQLANCQDSQVVHDVYEDIKKDVAESLKDYRKSMDLLKVEGWMGIKTLMFPATTSILAKLIALDPSKLTILSAVGVAMGAVSGLTVVAQKRRKLTHEYDYSYLFHMRREWENCYRGNDWNYYLCRQMEEFIHD
jgi:hypothetical protein